MATDETSLKGFMYWLEYERKLWTWPTVSAEGQPPMTQPSRFEAARKWLDEAVYSTGADGIPLLRLMMNTGLVFWALFLCLLVVAAYGGRALGVLLLPLLLYGTYLLGPVMQGRYLYPFLCVLPHFFLCAADAIRERAGRT